MSDVHWHLADIGLFSDVRFARQSTKSLRSSPLRGSKSREAGSRSRGQRWRGGKVNTISSCIVGVQRMIKNSKDHLRAGTLMRRVTSTLPITQ
jgi:hypothetical protein